MIHWVLHSAAKIHVGREIRMSVDQIASPWRLNLVQVGSLGRCMGFEKKNTIPCGVLEVM